MFEMLSHPSTTLPVFQRGRQFLLAANVHVFNYPYNHIPDFQHGQKSVQISLKTLKVYK